MPRKRISGNSARFSKSRTDWKRKRKDVGLEIVCRNCGYRWKTKPSRWRAKGFVKIRGKEQKVVRCPMCGVAIGLSREIVARIERAEHSEDYVLVRKR